MSLVVWYPFSDDKRVINSLRREMPSKEIWEWNDADNNTDIEYAVLWTNPPRGKLKSFPNLKCIFSMYAGVEDLVNDPDLPDVPVSHLIDKALTQGMTEYIVHNVLIYHRRHLEFTKHQRNKLWKKLDTPIASKRRIGIMGLGALGSASAKALIGLNFDVASWSRTSKSTVGLTSYHGHDGLSPFLAQTEILVCLLPLTPNTTGILNRDLFTKLPRGAYLINAGRGSSQVEEDILWALDTGQLAGVSLDVFEVEPLPQTNPFWTHPKVLITPHNASLTDIESAATTIATNIAGIESGNPIQGLVDKELGY